MRLYAPFYSSDIIVASPLGLRTVLGAEGDNKRDFDFLSSIELLVLDQADVYLMQNWEHILVSLTDLSKNPKLSPESTVGVRDSVEEQKTGKGSQSPWQLIDKQQAELDLYHKLSVMFLQ